MIGFPGPFPHQTASRRHAFQTSGPVRIGKALPICTRIKNTRAGERSNTMLTRMTNLRFLAHPTGLRLVPSSRSSGTNRFSLKQQAMLRLRSILDIHLMTSYIRYFVLFSKRRSGCVLPQPYGLSNLFIHNHNSAIRAKCVTGALGMTNFLKALHVTVIYPS